MKTRNRREGLSGNEANDHAKLRDRSGRLGAFRVFAVALFSALLFAISAYASSGQGPGKNNVPEIDPASGVAVLTLLTGALVVFRARQR